MAFSLVSSTKVVGTHDVTTPITTPAINTTGAKLLVAFVMTYSTFCGTLSDSKSNSWTKLTTCTYAGRTGSLYYCANPTAGTGHSFTFSGYNYQAVLFVQAWDGAAASPFDAENTGTASGATSISTGFVSPTVDGALIITGVVQANSGSCGIGSPFTKTDEFVDNPATDYCGGAIADLVQTSKCAVNPAWSWTGATAASAAIACFKPASGASGGSPFVFQPFAL